MWFRNLLLIAFVFAAATFIRRLLAAARTVSGARTVHDARRPAERAPLSDRMVRDRVCNTFLPQSRALSVERDGAVHYFCSAACRDAFLARPKSTAEAR